MSRTYSRAEVVALTRWLCRLQYELLPNGNLRVHFPGPARGFEDWQPLIGADFVPDYNGDREFMEYDGRFWEPTPEARS